MNRKGEKMYRRYRRSSFFLGKTRLITDYRCGLRHILTFMAECKQSRLLLRIAELKTKQAHKRKCKTSMRACGRFRACLAFCLISLNYQGEKRVTLLFLYLRLCNLIRKSSILSLSLMFSLLSFSTFDSEACSWCSVWRSLSVSANWSKVFVCSSLFNSATVFLQSNTFLN